MMVLTNKEGASGIDTAVRCLRDRKNALDAIEGAIRIVESDEHVWSVGRGGWPNLLGEVELDAAIMDGTSLRTGAVGAVKGYLHPISIARQVLEQLPHELLVGEGARRFANEINAEPDDLLMPHATAAWRRWFSDEVSNIDQGRWPEVALARYCQKAVDPDKGRDTTIFLAVDCNGTIACGTSTSGFAWKYPGRLGDSPIIGAGSYADSRYGACACTGTGEMTIRAGTARSVVMGLKLGMTLDEAVKFAALELSELRGGVIGAVTIYALSAGGAHKVAAVNSKGAAEYWFWNEALTTPECRASDYAH
jgi:L-asparaginase